MNRNERDFSNTFRNRFFASTDNRGVTFAAFLSALRTKSSAVTPSKTGMFLIVIAIILFLQKYNFVVIQPNNSPSSTLFPECSSISGKVCVTPPVAVSRFSQGKGRQYRRTWIWAKQPAYAMLREQESLHHSRREKWSHAGVRHEKGAPGQFFSLSHMHYVGRSFRLLNPSYVCPCAFGAFFRQKISPYGNFLPETEGKTRSPAGTDEL